MPKVVKVVSGPSSYPSGGFEISAGEYEKLEDANVEMHPDTILGTSIVPGFDISLSGNKATVAVYQIASGSVSTTWGEVSGGTDLSAAKFVLSGIAV